jgi:hypothetical protein
MVETKTSGIGGVSEICQPYVPILVTTNCSWIRWLFLQCDKFSRANSGPRYLVSSTENTHCVV